MRYLTYILILSLLVVSCKTQTQFDYDKEKQAILTLHNKQRDYHFNKDSIAFANQLSNNFISVNRGDITHPKLKETISRYHHYFSAVEFINWDDMSEPIIRFSDDGTLAYTIVDKLVKLKYSDEKGKATYDSTRFAWTTIYKKDNDEWKIDCVTSTEKQPN